MPTQIPVKFYKAEGGRYQPLPGTSENDARFGTSVGNDVIQQEISRIRSLPKMDDNTSQYLQGLENPFQMGTTGQSPFALDDKGVLTTNTALQAQQQQAQQIASGQMQNVGTAQAPLTVPKGTPDPKTATYQQSLAGPAGQLAAVAPVDPNAISKKYEESFNTAKSTGMTSPTDRTGANTMFNQSSLGQGTSTAINDFVSQDPFLNTLMAGYQKQMSQLEQRTSLVDTYKSMLKESGIQGIDTELLNMKNVIDGTEDDIRTEVTKAGGFATDSQVMALSNARNKQLIKNYNNLLETRNSKSQYLDTMMNLTSLDRQEADKRFEIQMNFGFKMAEINQTMKKNAIESIDRTAKTIGWDGVFNATQGNPQLQAQIERMYGLPQGGLRIAAQRAYEERIYAEQERELGLQEKISNIQESELGMQLKEQQLKFGEEDRPLDIQERKLGMSLKAEQIKTEKAQRAKIYADIQKIQKEQKGSILDPTTPEGAKQMATMKSQIDQVGSILNSNVLNNAVGTNIFSRTPASKKGFWAGVGDFVTGGGIRRVSNPGISNFVGDVEQLRSQLNLQSLIDAKARGATFGALSDQELQVLSNSATKIGTWLVKDANGNVAGYNAKESDFKKEMDKINNFAKLDYVYRGGMAEDVGVQVINGKYYSKNSDGSITEL